MAVLHKENHWRRLNHCHRYNFSMQRQLTTSIIRRCMKNSIWDFEFKDRKKNYNLYFTLFVCFTSELSNFGDRVLPILLWILGFLFPGTGSLPSISSAFIDDCNEWGCPALPRLPNTVCKFLHVPIEVFWPVKSWAGLISACSWFSVLILERA